MAPGRAMLRLSCDACSAKLARLFQTIARNRDIHAESSKRPCRAGGVLRIVPPEKIRGADIGARRRGKPAQGNRHIREFRGYRHIENRPIAKRLA
jgi:hypothetical protein